MVGPIVELLLFLFVGVGCVLGASYVLVRDHRRERAWCVADAQIVGDSVARVDTGDDGPYFRTIVEFTDSDGKTVHVRSRRKTTVRAKVGKHVRVCYPPGIPQKARIVGENRWLYVVATAGAALVAVAGLGIVGMLR